MNNSILVPEYWGWKIQYSVSDVAGLPFPVQVIKYFISPLIILLGLFGNSVTLIVITQGSFPQHSYAYFIGGLAVADTVMLFAYLASQINLTVSVFTLKDLIHARSDYACIAITHIDNFGLLSAWLMAVFSLERFYVVCFPLSARNRSTPRKALILVCIFALLSFLPVVPYWFYLFYDTESGLCVVRREFYAWHHIFLAIVMEYLPVGVVVVSNSITVFHLYKSKEIGASESKNKNVRHITNMLLILSLSFVFMTLPVWILESIYIIYPDHRFLPGLLGVNIVAELLQMSNYSVNGLVYFTFNREFRNICKSIFKCRKAK